MLATEKIMIGALGGLSAVMVKFLGQDYQLVVDNAANLTEDQIIGFMVGYGLLTPILMFLGGFVAWSAEEDRRLKLVALAVAAPAMITTWSGGNVPDNQAMQLNPMSFFVSSAYAAEEETQTKEKSTLDRIQQGVGIFFGYGKVPKTYWVIVGSYQEREQAQTFADRINADNKTLQAWVGIRTANNNYYPVIVGHAELLSEAKALRTKALESTLIKDAYLSPTR